MVALNSYGLFRRSATVCRLGWISAVHNPNYPDITFEEDGLNPESMRVNKTSVEWAHAKWLAVRQDLSCVPFHKLLITYVREEDGVTCWCHGRVTQVRLDHAITTVNPGDTFMARAFMDGYVFWLTYQEVRFGCSVDNQETNT